MKTLFIILQGLQLIAFSTQNCYNEYIHSKIPIVHKGLFRNRYEYPITHAEVHCTQVSLTSTAELSYFNSDDYDTHFIVSNSSINTLLAGVFEQIPKTAVINMSNNSIRSIETNAFAQLKNLRVVNLQFNNLTTIQDGMFASNKALQTLDLSYNSIISIGNAFPAISLKTLWLQYNKLHGVNFKLPTTLIYLNVSFNEITSIEKDAFFGLTSLVGLFLNDNRLESIPVGCFKDLNMLKQLDLSNNKLMITFGVFSGLQKVNRLNIANNSMTTLTESAFSDLESLANLNIENNLISKIDADAITKYLKSLATISLRGNKFDCNYLAGLIADFKKREIVILKGGEFFTSNVQGIPCADIQDVTTEKTDYVQKQTELLHEILQTLNTTSNDDFKNAMEDFFQNNSKFAEKSEETINKINEAFVAEFQELSRNMTNETQTLLLVLLQNFTEASLNNYRETKKGFNESIESVWQRVNNDLETTLTKSFDGLKTVLQNNSNLNATRELNEKLIAAFTANNNQSDLLMNLAKLSNESNAMFQNFTEKMLKHYEDNQSLWRKTYNESGQVLADTFKQLLSTLQKNISELKLKSTYIDNPTIRPVDNETEDVIKNFFNLLSQQKNVTKDVEGSHKKSWFYFDDSSFLYLLWHLATFCCIFIIMLMVMYQSCVKCSSYKEKPSKSHENVSEMYDFCYNIPS